MLKIFRKNFSSNLATLENKANKYVEVKIDNDEISKYRLANFIRNKYDLKWDIIQKGIRKKDIFIVRQDNIIRKCDEKLELNDKIYICKYTLNIFDKKIQEENPNLISHHNEKIKLGKNQSKKLLTNKNIFENKSIPESNLEEDKSNKIEKISSNPAEKPNIYIENPNKVNLEFIEENFKKNDDLTPENKFLLDLFKGMVIYASNLFFIIDKKYNIASQRGTYLKFSVDDCLKMLNQINPNNNLKLVHRLDRNVSGLMMIGNNLDFVRKIGEEMKESKISKTYVCLCQNIPAYFKELINEKRINILRAEHFKESLTGNIFSDETCENFTLLTKNGYSFERNPELSENNKIEDSKENNTNLQKFRNNKEQEIKEFKLKKLTNFAYNKILSEKISKENLNLNDENANDDKNKFNMQGIFRITHFIFKDIGEGKGNNFIAFEMDKIDMYDEETILKFDKFLERVKLNSVSGKKELEEISQKESKREIEIISKQDDSKSLKDLMKKQMKINKKEKAKLKELKVKTNNEDEFYTVVAYELISGKKHQIRKHMSKSFFTPIFNDEDYFFDTNLSYIAYKYYISEIEKQNKEDSLIKNDNNVNNNEQDFGEHSKEDPKTIKKLNFLSKLDKDDFYKRFNIDDLSKGIFLNSFQIKINNENFTGLKSEKAQFYDKNKLLILKNNNEMIYQKRSLSSNFQMLFDAMGLSYVNDYFCNIRKNNLI